MMMRAMLVGWMAAVLPWASGQDGGGGGKPAGDEIAPAVREALAKLKLPGVKIDLDRWCVDVEGEVCLRDGLLELVACTKDTKEHESIVMVKALPSHIHTALLLLGTPSGNPAMRKPVNDEGTMFVDLPPQGGPVAVSLVVKKPDGTEIERPVADFLVRAERLDSIPGGEGGKHEADDKFPTSTFLFAGSHLIETKEGPKKYLADESGSVVSIATFGDELLCLAGIHASENGSLEWGVDGTNLPAVGEAIVLRLRPEGLRKKEAASPLRSAEGAGATSNGGAGGAE